MKRAVSPLLQPNRWLERLWPLLAVVLCIVTVVTYVGSFGIGEAIAYPLEKPVADYDPYVQQFDALKKGQWHLDHEPADALVQLENPYDPDQREGIPYLYDRAYYAGAYYSYFGTAPIYTVMMPYFWLTGNLPSSGMIQLVFMLLFAIFMPLTVHLLGKTWFRSVHGGWLAAIAYTATVSSMQMMMGRGYTPFYYIAATSAMAFLAAFAYCLFKGVLATSPAARKGWLVAAGLAFALCFHSRVNTAFSALFFLVPTMLFGIVLKKRDGKIRLKDAATELGCLAWFAVIGVGLAMWLNYERFESVFEFGTTYQLTIADVSTYKLDVSEFAFALYHYFLAPLGTDPETGALALQYGKIGRLGRYLYVDGHFGLFVIPFLCLALLMPVVATYKRHRAFGITALSALVGTAVMAWLDFCLGGVIFRYLCDLSAMLAVLAALGAFWVIERVDTARCRWWRWGGYAVIAAALVWSLWRTGRVLAVHDRNLIDMVPTSLFARWFG